MNEILIKRNKETGFWNVYIDGHPAIKAKKLVRLARNLYKFIKGHPEMDM